MPNFLESPWMPDEMSTWAVGGRGWSTTVVQTYGGDEYRNAAWSRRLGRWSLQEALRSTNPLSGYYVGIVVNMHIQCMGRLKGFRMRDPIDYRNNDAVGAVGMTAAGTFRAADGGDYQMQKTYTITAGGWSYSEDVVKPRPAYGSYTGIVVTGGSGWTLDYDTGLLTGGSGTPTSWAGYYDVPVRFEDDIPDIGMLSDGTYWNWNDCKVVQLRNLEQ